MDHNNSKPAEGKSIQYLDTYRDGDWAAPVSYFKHAPFASSWDTIAVPNIYVEIPIVRRKGTEKPVYWIVQIFSFAGYNALGSFKSCLPSSSSSGSPSLPSSSGNTPTYGGKLMWFPLTSSDLKPLGFSQANKILLYPVGQSVELELSHVADVINQVYSAAFHQNGKPATLPYNISQIVSAELQKCAGRYTIGEIVEALDKHDCSGYRIAKVTNLVGDRIFVVYLNEDVNKKEKELGFWFSQNSPHIHKLGWCKTVDAPFRGVNIKLLTKKLNPTEHQHDLPYTPSDVNIEEQMVFEMRHPVFPHKICAGYVVKVLKHGYFVAGTDWSRQDQLVEIVLHVSSDYILPIGFCHQHKIPFEMPLDGAVKSDNCQVEPLSWKKYLLRCNLKVFNPPIIAKSPNKFSKGCKLEAINIVEPTKIHPATVIQIAGRLLRIHFDGNSRTDQQAFQWVSCSSTTIYPVGYAEMVGHPFG